MVSSTDGTESVASIQTMRMAATDSGRGPGFAFMQFLDLLVYGCYCRPGGPLWVLEGSLSGLEANMRQRLRPDLIVVVAGNFNAKAKSWRSAIDDARGVLLEQFAASMGLWSENVRSVPTFAMGGRFSMTDVTLAQLPRGSSVRGWRVREDLFSDSNHGNIEFGISSAIAPTTNQPLQTGWMTVRSHRRR